LRKVLLVDDDATQLRIREAVLRNAGFEILTATSAEPALAILRSQTHGSEIGVIITDHIMPGASGVEFLCQIRQINPIVPVVVLSGLPEAEAEYEGQNVIFRQKPCPPAEIISLVRRSFDSAA
jgi:DNA-binding NtrC family response regulator